MWLSAFTKNILHIAQLNKSMAIDTNYWTVVRIKVWLIIHEFDISN